MEALSPATPVLVVCRAPRIAWQDRPPPSFSRRGAVACSSATAPFAACWCPYSCTNKRGAALALYSPSCPVPGCLKLLIQVAAATLTIIVWWLLNQGTRKGRWAPGPPRRPAQKTAEMGKRSSGWAGGNRARHTHGTVRKALRQLAACGEDSDQARGGPCMGGRTPREAKQTPMGNEAACHWWLISLEGTRATAKGCEMQGWKVSRHVGAQNTLQKQGYGTAGASHPA